MKERICCIGKKILSKLLVLLGFSTTFVFMACYGPRPNYAPVDFDDTDSMKWFHLTLRRTGVIDALRKAGAGEGDTVQIEDMQFDFID